MKGENNEGGEQFSENMDILNSRNRATQQSVQLTEPRARYR